ncbi:MAG TPA: methyl-accepting chemotaxis protein, partial [Clostridia bacterium]|nr:methyl-accepting chemotaxis protein [Clostridia bacterium]
NEFIEGLNKSVKEIKIAAEDTVQVKDKLLLTIDYAQESSGSIATSTESIGEQVGQLDGRIGESMASVDTMASHSAGVLEMLQDQTAMVEESNASINEMISSIRNVAETSHKKYAATAILTETSRRGSEKLIATTSLIEEVTEKVDDIRAATSVIRNVAAQTSLLAMNAAIEAAHAGEKGAGFAVVAEEIRKLSDTTTESSKRIGNFLNEVINKIQLTSQVGEETKQVFEEVASVVQEVSSSLTEITESMRELNIGGEQILEATTKLQEFSINLRERGQQMGTAAEDLTRIMDYTRTTSSMVLESVSHIGNDVGKINASMQSVTELSKSLNDMTLRVEGAVKVFTTERIEPIET